MAQKVQILPDKIGPSLRPGSDTGDSKHPNAPIRLRGGKLAGPKKNPVVKDRGNRSF